jgi:anti-sigma B factor antagonist
MSCMDLVIEVREVNDVVMMELAGRLSIFEQSLRHLATDLIESGERQLIINLANVSYLDNSGLGQLCWIYTLLQNRGGELALVKPTARIREVLSITKLDTVFQSFESESEAIRWMEGVRPAISA